jgi:hypothetical protein
VVPTALADGETEVSVLLPRRQYTHFWHRFLHDRTADAIAQALSVLPHSNVTIVPYHLGSRAEVAPPEAKSTRRGLRRADQSTNGKTADHSLTTTLVGPIPADCTPIAEVQYRQHTKIAGRLHTMRVQPHGGIASLECTLVDETGGIALVFLGRRSIPGMKVGARVRVEGTVGEDHGRLAMLNPTYEFLPEPAPKAH